MSSTYRGDQGNNTPYFLIPTILVAGAIFLVLPFDLFLVVIAASAASFYAHVYLDKEYHVEGSSLARFTWFRRKQQLHFVHHLHANRNFAVIDFFWDRNRPGTVPSLTATGTIARRSVERPTIGIVQCQLTIHSALQRNRHTDDPAIATVIADRPAPGP